MFAAFLGSTCRKLPAGKEQFCLVLLRGSYMRQDVKQVQGW